MAAKKIRLFKIASEINIGKDAIVDYLQSKGFSIENKPTASLTEDMVETVYDKFKREKKAAEVQREKIQKQKDIRKQSRTDSNKDEKGSAKSTSIDKSKILDELFGDEEDFEEVSDPKIIEIVEEETVSETVSETEVEAKTEETDEDNAEKPSDEKDEVTSKQEKEEITSSREEAVNEIIEDKPEDEKEAETSSVDEEVKETKAEEPVEEKPKSETKTKSKSKKSSTKGKKENSDVESKAEEETIEETIEVEKTEEIIAKEEDESSKRTKKGKEFADPDKRPELKGLKVMGKISLKVEEAKPSFKKRKKKRGERGQTDERRDSQKRSDGREQRGDKKKFDKSKSVKTDKKEVKGKDDKEKVKDDVNSAAVPTPDANLRKRKKRTTEINIAEETSKANANKKKRKKKKSIREQIKQEDVEKALKATLAGMADTKTKNRAKLRAKKKEEREAKEEIIKEEKAKEDKILQLTEYVTTSDLANLMEISTNDIILECMQLGLMVTINQRLDKDTIQLIADDYGYEIEFLDEKETVAIEDTEDDEETLESRPPIVTIMGHVDHGKTSLLDYIRSAKVVAGEAGGITQHMGAYKVEVSEGKFITFLDTPGHEAFTAMRARGAQVTDIVILVVAADDAVMPQTLEAISHAQAAEVPIVVAINKMDKPHANSEKIKQELSEHDILVEQWGGKYQSVELSAKTGMNVDKLLETVLLESEMLELKANPNRDARGTVIESHMEKGLGPVATVVVQKGTINIGDPFVAGAAHGKIRVLFDERNNKLENVPPAHPVKVIGLDALPSVGDSYITVQSETFAKNIANERAKLKREQELRQIRHATLDDISADIAVGGIKDLFLILKGDVTGSIEALSDSLLKLSTEEVKVVILHKGVGDINENDINLAIASKAVVIGFNTNPTSKAKRMADKENIEIRNYDIIYDCINDIEQALEGMLAPEINEEISGEAEVRKIFKIGRTQKIAGCRILTGKIRKTDKIKLLRDGLPIFEGKISSLKREKDDAKEVSEGFECGIMLDGFTELKEGDLIQTFKITETARKLKR